jgi:hypothetical protein
MKHLWLFISDLSSLIPVVAGFYFYKRLKKDRRILLYLLLYAVWVEISNAWMASRGIYNLWQINIYTLVEFTLLLFVFNLWVKHVIMRWLSLIGAIAFYLFWAFVFLQAKNLNVVNLPADITGSVVMLLASGFVVTTLSLETEQALFRNYKFIFGSASLIYFCVNTFLSYIFTLLVKNPGLLEGQIWNIHSVINIAVNIIYAYSFSLKEKD